MEQKNDRFRYNLMNLNIDSRFNKKFNHSGHNFLKKRQKFHMKKFKKSLKSNHFAIFINFLK